MLSQEKALKYIERLPNNLELGSSGIRIKEDKQRLPKQYKPDEIPPKDELFTQSAREEMLDRMLFDRIADYLSSHIFEFKMPTVVKETMEEARKKGGGGGLGGGGGDKKGGYMPYLLLFQLKAATVGAVALKAIALVAFKALVIAKIAFTIASIIALKKLLEQKHHTSTYEVLAPHPHYEDYDRSFNPSDLVFKGHKIV